MRRGRPVGDIQRKAIEIRLPEELVAKLNLLSLDPLNQKLSYGKRNDLIENALTEYFAKYYPLKGERS